MSIRSTLIVQNKQCGTSGLPRYGHKRGVEAISNSTDVSVASVQNRATLSAQRLKELQEKYQASAGAQRMMSLRHKLPSFSMREQFIATLEQNQARSPALMHR
jgi:hypothetical protein